MIGELYQSFEKRHHSSQKSHLAMYLSKITVMLGNDAPQKWSFIPCTIPGYSNGFYIINTTHNLALRYDLYTGEIMPSPLVFEKESFIWKRTPMNVWKDQDDYFLTPFKDSSRRLTTETIQIPIYDGNNGTFCTVNIVRLCGIAGTPRNQSWIFEEDPCEENSETSDVESPSVKVIEKKTDKNEKIVRIIDEVKEFIKFKWVFECIVKFAFFIIEKQK
ncbi:3729_t:CDS:1 [Ambispora leptoticha]|uniref:3729_t:CDS:1 n=1 Tax=Ambispora leptoticha TaxID=144679 RepID=A0A9N8ZXX6_9GLOM|nr:3729_t:CDS:1 [Ambispora leptoticha]